MTSLDNPLVDLSGLGGIQPDGPHFSISATVEGVSFRISSLQRAFFTTASDATSAKLLATIYGCKALPASRRTGQFRPRRRCDGIAC